MAAAVHACFLGETPRLRPGSCDWPRLRPGHRPWLRPGASAKTQAMQAHGCGLVSCMREEAHGCGLVLPSQGHGCGLAAAEKAHGCEPSKPESQAMEKTSCRSSAFRAFERLNKQAKNLKMPMYFFVFFVFFCVWELGCGPKNTYVFVVGLYKLRAATQKYTCLCGSRLGSGNVFGLFSGGT